ncbi:MAG: amine oxidase [Myxococcaceae bacterium]|nr:amine oxidase [Myxococcaceae bacterium]
MYEKRVSAKDVVILGGGLAGLTTAVGLRELGLSVVVIERARLLGGRARSWIDGKTGDPVHIGPHIFLNHYPNMMRLLDLCGTRDKVVWETNGRFLTMVDGQREVPIRASALPPPYHYVPSLLGDPETTMLDLVSNWPLVELAATIDEAGILRLDAMNALDLLREVKVSERFIQRFWSFTAMAIMNVPLEKCSAGALIRFYRHLVGHADIQVGFPDGGLGDLYAPQCRALIEAAGGEVRNSTRATSLTGDGDRVTGVEIVNADGSTETIEARFVVAALSPQALAKLARPSWAADHAPFGDLDAFAPVPYVSTFIWFDRKLGPLQFWARAFREQDLNCDFYDLSNIHRGWRQRPSVIASNIIYSDRIGKMTDAEIVLRTRDEIAEFLPDARRATVRHAVVNRIPMAIHAPAPGTESLRPTTRTGIEGLLLAGDWIKTDFPASMESAVRSGWMAAEAIAKDVGQHLDLTRSVLPPVGLVPWLKDYARHFPFKKTPARIRDLARG